MQIGKRAKCPTCGEDGVVIYRTVMTTAKGKKYTYRKLYCYHNKRVGQKQCWHYLTPENLKMLGVRGKQATIQNTIQKKSASKRASSLEESLGRDSNPRPTAYKAIALTS